MSDEPAPPGLWRNGNWRLLWAGQAVSLLGDMVFMITVLLWIATTIARGQPWAPAAASGALLAMAVPVLVVGPFAGVFVDRWNRRRTMLVADAARTVLVAGLLVIPALGDQAGAAVKLAILYAVLAGCTVFKEFFDPSRLAVLGEIVSARDQPKASGQLTATSSMAQILGPPLAAPLLFAFGVQWALILNAASFAISFACVRAIRLAPPAPAPAAGERERPGFAAELGAGLRFFAGNRVLVALGTGVVIATLGTGAVNALLVFFVPANLHVAASWVGTLTGGVGAGAVAGALLTGLVTRRVRPPQVFWAGLAACGIALVGLSRATALVPALVAAVLVGLALGLVNAVIWPILLDVTPARMLGRVSAVFSPLQQLASVVSMVLAGALASTVLRGFRAEVAGVRFGPYDTVFAVAGLLFVAGGLASVPLLREPAAGSQRGELAGEVVEAEGAE